LADSSGATAIEYALIAGFISIAIVTAAIGIGQNLASMYNKVAQGFTP
jgi:pilus assembly protein Flp/PilA